MIWGLHLIDIIVIGTFIVATLVIGLWVSRGVKGESDFFLGGRKLGKLLQFFLNFGNSTDPTGALTISSNVYSKGVSGIWGAGFQTLFITPFFWFAQPWHRRARLTTMADLFVDRFNSKGLATSYALFNVFIALIYMGLAMVSVYKVTAAMVVKPEAEYSVADRQSVADYKEYMQLVGQVNNKTLASSDERYQALHARFVVGDLNSTITYVSKLPFYFCYCLIVGIYITMGGLKAAAITDAIQGLLILVMSILLIPLGLHAVGGFAGLHTLVPAQRFDVTGDLTVFSIFGFFIASLVQIVGLVHNMSTGGSARDEDTARFGQISGGFSKRLVLIMWMLCGLLAVALIQNLSDPDLAWGRVSNRLLMPGLAGLMLSGMILGLMPMMGVWSVSVSALVTRNIYEPLVKGRTPAHYLRAGQVSIGVVLLLAIVSAYVGNSVIDLYTNLVTFNTFFGGAVILIYTWKRLTAKAVGIGLVLWILGVIMLPSLLPRWNAFSEQPGLLIKTQPITVDKQRTATQADVDAHRAGAVGEKFMDQHVIAPAPVFFTAIAREQFDDPNSPMHGTGRFSTEIYLLKLARVPMEKTSPGNLTATRWLVDGLFPFVMLIGLSLVTKPVEEARARRFYAKMCTPVQATPELDQKEVDLNTADPTRINHVLLFPGTNWRVKKWKRKDFVGFFGCWAIVGAILLVLWGVLSLGS
jgi:SSS family solute:Na+ symporter